LDIALLCFALLCFALLAGAGSDMAVGGYEHGSLTLLLRMNNNMGSLLAWLSSRLVVLLPA